MIYLNLTDLGLTFSLGNVAVIVFSPQQYPGQRSPTVFFIEQLQAMAKFTLHVKRHDLPP